MLLELIVLIVIDMFDLNAIACIAKGLQLLCFPLDDGLYQIFVSLVHCMPECGNDNRLSEQVVSFDGGLTGAPSPLSHPSNRSQMFMQSLSNC